jgi:hypothetical protein
LGLPYFTEVPCWWRLAASSWPRFSAIAAFAVFGVSAAFQQQHLNPISREALSDLQIDWTRVFILSLLLLAFLGTNLIGNSFFPDLELTAPALGLGLWAAILATSLWRKPDWAVAKEPLRAQFFWSRLSRLLL